jgi:hypothetical protein
MRLPNSREPAGRYIYNGGLVLAAGAVGFLFDLGHVINWILVGAGGAMIVRGLFYMRRA